MEENNHQLYSKNLSIGVLQLQYTERAMPSDISNNLVLWAKLFNADTWEDFKAVAKDYPAIKEVGDLMLKMNVDQKDREILEAQRKFREQYASQYTAGYTDAEEKLTPLIDELQEQVDKQAQDLEAANRTIAGKDAAIAKLQAEIDALKTNY